MTVTLEAEAGGLGVEGHFELPIQEREGGKEVKY